MSPPTDRPAYEIFLRDGCTCAYCGYQGKSFDMWMQLTIDHVLPKSQDGLDTPENKVTACYHCNSAILGRYKVTDPAQSVEAIKMEKKRHAQNVRAEYFQEWLEQIAPHLLDATQ